MHTKRDISCLCIIVIKLNKVVVASIDTIFLCDVNCDWTAKTPTWHSRHSTIGTIYSNLISFFVQYSCVVDVGCWYNLIVKTRAASTRRTMFFISLDAGQGCHKTSFPTCIYLFESEVWRLSPTKWPMLLYIFWWWSHVINKFKFSNC